MAGGRESERRVRKRERERASLRNHFVGGAMDRSQPFCMRTPKYPCSMINSSATVFPSTGGISADRTSFRLKLESSDSSGALHLRRELHVF